MNICVNTRLLLKDKLEGIGWFTFETLRRITSANPEHNFFFIFDRAYSEDFIFGDNVTPIVASPPTRHPILWKYWFDYAIPSILKKYKADLFISTDGLCSLKTDVPQLVVMHDLAFEHYPEHLPKMHLNYLKKYSPLFAKKAKRIVTVSEFSKQDIHQKYGIALDKIDVVYNGASDLCKPLYNGQIAKMKAKFADDSSFFLFVSAIHPRKNLINIMRAFDEFKSENNSDVKLVVAGRKAWSNQHMEQAYERLKFKSDVVFTGHLKMDELVQVYASSIALVYPSMFEGFGIPILEAMNCDIPVITSNVSSMPEVANGAAILVDPLSVKEISKAMYKMHSDESLRQDLISHGREQRKRFSWDQTAEKLWSSIEKTMALSSAMV